MITKYFLIFLVSFVWIGQSFGQTCTSLFARDSVAARYYSILKHPDKLIKSSTGIEVEAMWPKKKGLQQAAEEAAKFLTEQGFEVQKKFHFEPVSRSYRTRVFTIEWKFKDRPYQLKLTQDFSVRPEIGYEAIEIVSPILYNSADANVFINLISRLSKLGLREEPNHSGIHIHVGLDNVTPAELGMIEWGFHLFEQAMRRYIHFSDHRSGYVGPKPDSEISDVRMFRILESTVDEFITHHYPNKENRYVGINLASMKKFGTVEIRLFNSSVHPRVIRFARHFARKLVMSIRNKNPDLIAVLERAELGLVELPELFSAIGLHVEKAQEIEHIMKIEKESTELTSIGLWFRMLRVLPSHVYWGYIKGVLKPDPTPEGWTSIE